MQQAWAYCQTPYAIGTVQMPRNAVWQPQFAGYSPYSTGYATPAQTPPVIPTQHPNIIPTEVKDKMGKLQAELKATQQDLTTCQKLLANSGLFTKESSGGMIGRPGKPPKPGSEKHTARLEERARGVLVCSRLIQGGDLVKDMLELAKEALKIEPKVRGALMDAICEVEGYEEVDKRFKSSMRPAPEQPLIATSNAFHAMVSTGITKSSISSLREQGGKRLIDDASTLQKWAVNQPEMPDIQFVSAGESTAVFTPLDTLIKEKLMTCDKLVQSLRNGAPFKEGKQIVYYMVSCAHCH